MKASSLWAIAKILFGSGFTVVASYGLGRWFLRVTGAWPVLRRGERAVFAFAMGAAWLSNLVFVLCAARLAYIWVFAAAGAIWIWAGLRARDQPPAEEPERLPWWFLIPAACYGYLYLINALAPEISADGAGYHLGLVSRYLRDHGFSRITTSMYAMLSQGMEMLFLFAYAFGRHSAAKMTHFAFLLATAAAMVWFGRRFRLPEAGAAAAALFAFSPVVGVDATSSYNDCTLALFTFLTFYLLLVWEENPNPALLPAIGVAAGFCFSIKYTGFLALPFALWFLRRGGALRASLFAACFIAPWMIKNAILIGNPVAPFFNRFFPNPYIHVSLERSYTYLMRHYSGLAEQNWRDYLQYPLELVVRGGKLQGLLGPVFLLAPLGLWSLRQRIGRRLWVAALLFALPWLSNNGTRFLLPALVFLSLAMAAALWQAPRRFAVAGSVLLVVAHGLTSWPSVIPRWDKEMIWRLEGAPWKAALRRESEEQYLSRVSPDYNVARMIDRVAPRGARVYASLGVLESYTSHEIIGDYQSALGEVLADLLLAPVVEPWAPVWNIRLEWEPRDLAGLRLIQTGSAQVDQWSIHELLLFSGTTYIVPDRSWALRAHPNPWDAAMAVDGNPATRWRTWWPLFPGMRFQVEFPQPLRLSAMELHCSADQYPLKLQAEGKDPAGRWFSLQANQRLSQREPWREEMKRYATHEIKRRGVDYLLTDVSAGGSNVMAPSIERDPGAWGVIKVAEYGPIKLYKIE